MTTRNQEIDNALKSHDKAITEIQATLSALSKQQEAILKAVTEKTVSGSGEGGGSGSTFNTNGADSRNNISLRTGNIDFPMFSGDDVEGWVYHCEHFFAMDETPEGMKLRYAVVHLEGDALQWHRAYLRTHNATVAEIQWDEYVRSISARFSNAMFEDPLEELASLNQTCSLHDLNTTFDALLNKVNPTKSQAISLNLKALSLDIRGMVKMFRPRTLHEDYGLAKTQALNNESLEEKINKDKGNSGNTRNYSNFNITPPVNASKSLLLTPKPAKTTFTKSNRGPLYVIKMEDDDDEETEEIGAEMEEKEHQISIHALTGLPSYSTMRAQGSVVEVWFPIRFLRFVSFTSFPALGTSFVACELFSVVFACLLSCVSCWCSGSVVSFNPGSVNLFDEVLVVPRFHSFLAPLWGSGFRVVAQVWCLLRLFASDVVLGLAPWLLLQHPCWIAIVLRALYPSMAILRFHYPFAGLNECHDGGGNGITKAYLITYLRDRHCKGEA
uniref:Ty3 transposon capsid-like protein domain-containing protein n=1 Tax=Tanacetum cinerariifolium TaxID=118510 RepID=A0A699HKY5_TANCI|nr:hypothetical protein [Tanacetum cinerariifolium]